MAHKIKPLVKHFLRTERGTVAVLVGLGVTAMAIVAGTAIDYERASSSRAALQTALDASTLTAATSSTLSDAERTALATRVFAANWNKQANGGAEAEPEFEIAEGEVRGTVSLDLPTTFMRIAGVTLMDVGAESVVTISEEMKAEVALVLDYSWSMTESSGGQVKFEAMRAAAKKLVADLGALGEEKVKIGLVPFSHQIYLTLPKEYVVGQVGAGDWTGCTQDRKHDYNISDATPIDGIDASKWGHPQSSAFATYPCDGNAWRTGYAARSLKVLPITDDLAAVDDQLTVMEPYQGTHIALGAEFGWHLLSPTAPFTDVTAYGDAKTKKYMVLLTDGRQTEHAFGPGGTRNQNNGEANLTTICSKMKDEGITIVTIAFDLEEQATRDRLDDCASDPDPEKHFFVAEDGDDLATAFEDIKNAITGQVFVSK